MIDQHLLLLWLLLGVATMLSLGAQLLLRQVRLIETQTIRLRAINGTASRAGRERNSRVILTVTAAVGLGLVLMRKGLLPRKTLHEAEILLAGANLRGETVVAGFIGGKLLLLAVLPVLGWAMATLAGQSDHFALLTALAAAAGALVLPDILLGRRRRTRLAAIDRGLPDALDLLVLCVDAGLAFEAALERVTREIASVHPAIAEEFAITVNALRISTDRRAALMDMGARLDLDFMRQLAGTLVQSLQLGAPLARSLRQLAQELRREQMVRVEAKAAKLPVLLTIPMVIFIMPTVLLVVGGPAAIQVIRSL